MSNKFSTELYLKLIDIVFEEDFKQRWLSRGYRGINWIPELSLVYQYEKKIHECSNAAFTPITSSAREYSTDSVSRIDLFIASNGISTALEFKMDCGISDVASDAVKLMPIVKHGDYAFVINIKSEYARDLGDVTDRRTKMLNEQIRTFKVGQPVAVPVVSEFDFISSPATEPKLADVICMWRIENS